MRVLQDEIDETREALLRAIDDSEVYSIPESRGGSYRTSQDLERSRTAAKRADTLRRTLKELEAEMVREQEEQEKEWERWNA